MSAEGYSEAGKETTFISQVSPFLTNWPQSHHHQLELFLIIHLLFGGTKLNLSTRCLEGLNSVYPLAVSGQACKISQVQDPRLQFDPKLSGQVCKISQVQDPRFQFDPKLSGQACKISQVQKYLISTSFSYQATCLPCPATISSKN